MDAFELEALLREQRSSGRLYLEFLRVPALSAGVYALAAGGTDPQGPHTEDEVYYVAKGRGMIRVAEEDRPVGLGSIVFVGAGVEHRFHTIDEDLEILVFFGPAEGSLKKPTA